MRLTEFFKKLFNTKLNKFTTKNKDLIGYANMKSYSNGVIVTDDKNNNLAIFNFDNRSSYYMCTQSIVKEFYQGHTYALNTIKRFTKAGLTLNIQKKQPGKH